MGRDTDPSIRQKLLEKVFQYLLEYGIQDLSLRPLAASIGTNARMLIYHFGSKEQMIVDALVLAQKLQMQALAQTPPPQNDVKTELIHLWQWFSHDDFLPFAKLLFQIEAQAMSGNELYLSFAQETLVGWAAFIQARFPNCDTTTAHVIVNMVSGLLLDRVIHQDKAKVDESFEAFADLISKNATL